MVSIVVSRQDTFFSPAAICAPGDQPGTREVSSEGHRIIYAVEPDTGRNTDAGDETVLRVLGPGQSRGLNPN